MPTEPLLHGLTERLLGTLLPGAAHSFPTNGLRRLDAVPESTKLPVLDMKGRAGPSASDRSDGQSKVSYGTCTPKSISSTAREMTWAGMPA